MNFLNKSYHFIYTFS